MPLRQREAFTYLDQGRNGGAVSIGTLMLQIRVNARQVAAWCATSQNRFQSMIEPYHNVNKKYLSATSAQLCPPSQPSRHFDRPRILQRPVEVANAIANVRFDDGVTGALAATFVADEKPFINKFLMSRRAVAIEQFHVKRFALRFEANVAGFASCEAIFRADECRLDDFAEKVLDQFLSVLEHRRGNLR